MFYEQEAKYKTQEELEKAMEDYIYYYNNKRIKRQRYKVKNGVGKFFYQHHFYNLLIYIVKVPKNIKFNNIFTR